VSLFWFPIFKPATPTNQERKTDPIRILLVEDDEDYREIVASELSWHGFAVRSFADGVSLLGLLDTALGPPARQSATRPTRPRALP
jgi:hypothetical protein